jgi:PhzF family phenazine biosynthesis protein
MIAAMRQWTVDAFASQPFRGNPACVVEPFDAWPDEAWMQALAQENARAETAFLVRTADPGRFGLRWFTPAIEVPLCGHATLASSHVLFAELGLAADAVAFDTRSGPLAVAREGEGYRMDFPADPPLRTEVPAGLAEALGAEPAEVWAAGYLLAILADEAAVRGLKPDIAALAAISSAARRPGNLIVAAPGEAGGRFDVVSRFFAPGSGIAEDPATGSAHCIIAPLFAQKLGKSRLSCHQAFPGRGGDLTCEAAGDRVFLSGRAVVVAESRLRV